MKLLLENWRQYLNEQNVRATGQCFPFAFQKAKDWINQHTDDTKSKRSKKRIHPDMNNMDKFKIVHGTVKNTFEEYPKPVVHGWVEMGDIVFDAQTSELKPGGISKKDYYETFEPEVYKEFSAIDALVNCIKHRGEGPWDDELYDMILKRDAWLKDYQLQEKARRGNGTEMKLLLENWRQYRIEEEIKSQNFDNWGDWVTVDHLENIIKMSRKAEEPSEAKKWLAGEMGFEFIKALPTFGNVVALGGVLKDAYKRFRRSPDAAEGAKEFPILDKLDVDPHLITVIDNDVMNEMDEEYQRYLESLPGETLIKDIIDVNDYIRGVIATDTYNHVVIRDESE